MALFRKVKNMLSKKATVKKALIRLIYCILGTVLFFALLFVIVSTAYGNIFKMQVINDAIECDLFKDGELVDYSYFPGRLSATLVFPEHQYQEIKNELQLQNMACLFSEIDLESVRFLEIPHTLDNRLQHAEYFVGGPLDNFCGILCHAEDETVCYVAQPAHLISEKWAE